MRPTLHLLTAIALLVACKGASTSVDDPPAGEVELDGACALDVDHGGFSVTLGDGAGVEGKVADGVVPIEVLEEIAAEGDCVLLRRNNPFCEPACDRSQTCDFDGRCIDYPENQDLGQVVIDGLVQEVVMDPVFPGNTYYDTSLPDPPVEPGALVALRIPDAGEGEPLTLYGLGVEPLAPSDSLWSIAEGQDLTVGWAVPTETESRVRVDLQISIDQHGATPGLLRCSFEDAGEGTVPATIVDALIASGVTGFPTGTLTRRTVDHGEAAGGCADFQVAHPVDVEVDVAGYTPCTSDPDCPDGLTCNRELQICE